MMEISLIAELVALSMQQYFFILIFFPFPFRTNLGEYEIYYWINNGRNGKKKCKVFASYLKQNKFHGQGEDILIEEIKSTFPAEIILDQTIILTYFYFLSGLSFPFLKIFQ